MRAGLGRGQHRPAASCRVRAASSFRHSEEGDPATLKIVNANMVANGMGSFVHGQTVVVRGGPIAAIGPHDQVQDTNAGTILDSTGKFLIPSSIDAEFHLMHVRANR